MARKQKNIHYLYKTTCVITGRWYIGMHSTNNLDDGYMGSGKRLRRSIRKYGVDNHIKEILEFFETRELLIEAEKEAITGDMVEDPMCMNLKNGGEGGFISEEQQRHRSQCANKKLQEKMNNNLDFRFEITNKISQARLEEWESGKRVKKQFVNWTDKKHSDETKQKMSESSKGQGVGESNSQYGTMWIHCKSTGEVKKIKKEDWISYTIKSDCIWEKGRK